MSTSFTNLTGFPPDVFAVPPNQRMGRLQQALRQLGAV